MTQISTTLVMGALALGCSTLPGALSQDGDSMENLPPHIRKDQVAPTASAEVDGVIRVARSSLPLTFTAPSVQEPNLQDVLFARWFVGYRAETVALNVVRQEETVGGNGPTRSLAPFELSAAMLAGIDAARAAAGVPVAPSYEVRLKVSDREPANHTSWSPLPDNAGEDEWRWVVEIIP